MNTKVWQITVDENHHGQRIDNYLFRTLKNIPKTHVYKILRKGEVRVNKKRIKPDYRLQTGDIIRIPPLKNLDTSSPPKPRLEHTAQLKDRIVYEDDEVIVINKPSGMATHGGSGIVLGVIETLRGMRPKEKFLELVHRLDRDTSGCLLIAKKSSVLKHLHMLLREGKMEKTYQALVMGQWSKRILRVDAPLRKSQMRSGERMVDVHEEGKSAITDFKILKQFEDTTLVEAKPLTGRTHQIRVHALHAGHPIVGDEKYGDKQFNKAMREKGLKRLFLHAAAIKFTFPDSDQPILISAPLDSELDEFLKNDHEPRA